MLVKQVISAIFSTVPFLAWGPFGLITSVIVTAIADKIFKEAALQLEIELIPIKNEILRKEFDRASIKLKLLACEKGIDSPEFKEARNANVEALSKLVRLN